MIKRNFLVILFSIPFIFMIYEVLRIPTSVAVKALPTETTENLPPDASRPFKGRVEMPGIENIYVMENTAGRDIGSIGKFLQGRAAGLHWLASKNLGEISLDLRLTVNAQGDFTLDEVMFSNLKEENFHQQLKEHIEYYWKLPKMKSEGVTQFWIPLRWKKFSGSRY